MHGVFAAHLCFGGSCDTSDIFAANIAGALHRKIISRWRSPPACAGLLLCKV